MEQEKPIKSIVVGTGTWVCFPVLEARKNEINQGVLEINPERLDCCLINRRWLLDANLNANTYSTLLGSRCQGGGEFVAKEGKQRVI